MCVTSLLGRTLSRSNIYSTECKKPEKNSKNTELEVNKTKAQLASLECACTVVQKSERGLSCAGDSLVLEQVNGGWEFPLVLAFLMI